MIGPLTPEHRPAGMDTLAQLNSSLAGRYTVEREIGAGGMATVYLARDIKHNRRVALKVLKPELGAVLGVERFLAEIQVTANLQHPNILPLFDSGEANGLLFYVMPYIEGETLRGRLEREQQLPIDEALQLAAAVAGALDYAHRNQVVHRDLKPENILLHEGQPLVADFGIALAVTNAGGTRITQPGLSLGTPQYMSPEQATGDRVIDGRSDIYSLGAVTYEMLTGEPPHTGATAQAIIARLLTERPQSIRASRPGVPAHVEVAVMRALEKLAADRWPTAGEFASALQGRALRPAARRRMFGSVAAVAVAAGLGVGGWWFAHNTTAPAAADSAIRSIAVLPFDERNTGGDAFLGDGMAETLIFALGKVPGFRVAAQTSAFTFRGKAADLKTIGDKLGVATVLTGSLQRAGNRLRVTVRLENVADHSELWTEQYDREVKDVFALEDDIARAVVNRLQSSSQKTPAGAIVNAGTRNVEAYQAYLQGRYFWGQRGDGIRKGLPFFERAVALDAEYALAWTGVADSYSLLSFYGERRPREAMPKARQAADRALTLDPGLAAAHASLAYILETHDFDWTGAEREYQRAIALDSTYVVARYWYGDFLSSSRGRSADGLVQSRVAVALDPLSAQAANLLSFSLAHVGKFDEAIAEARRAVALVPSWNSYRMLGSEYVLAGRLPEALAVLDTAIRLSRRHPYILTLLAVALVQTGDTAKAPSLYNELVDGVNAGRVQAIFPAVAASWLGRTDDALSWLAKARDEHDGPLSFPHGWQWPPAMSRDPRFVAFWAQLGVTPAPGAEQKP